MTDPLHEDTPHARMARALKADLTDQMGEWQNYTARLDYRRLARAAMEAYAEWVTVQVERRGDSELMETVRRALAEVREGKTLPVRRNEDGEWEVG